MFVEFENIYRLLDLAEEADASTVRDVFAQRLAAIEAQKESAGSRPERLMAAKALNDLKSHEEEVERLASALEAQSLIAEATAALENGKAAKASRAIKNARAAATKAGLRALDEAVSEAEDSLADSGLVRDPALDAEIEELAAKLAAIESALHLHKTTGSELPADTAATLASLEGKRAALLARVTARKDEETRAILQNMAEKLSACQSAIEQAAAKAARNQAINRLRTARVRLETTAPPASLGTVELGTLESALAEITPVLAEAPPAAVANDEAWLAEKSAMESHADAIRAEIERRKTPPPLPKKPAKPAPPPVAETPPPATPPPPVEKPAPKPVEPTAPPPPPPTPTELDATVPYIPPPVPTGPMAVKRFTLTGPKGARLHVVSGTTIVFGRSRDTDVAIRAHHPTNQKEANRVTRAVSRMHFTIFLDDGVPTLADGTKDEDGTWKRSVNGTFLDEDTEAEKVPITSKGPYKFHVTREIEPAVPPAWEIRLQENVTLPAEAADIAASLPPGPDALLLTRTDGSKHDVLIIWRAADLRALGLTNVDTAIIRQGDTFILVQEGRTMELETGYRVGGAWQVAKMGELTYGD